MLIDLHVHTSRYSSCGRATPEQMLAAAIEAGLGGVALTEHNLVFPDTEIAALRREFPQLLIFQGIEITSAEGDDYLLYGLRSAVEHEREDALQRGVPGERLVHRAHELGLAVVLAHPYRYGDQVPAFLEHEPVDGIEVMSSNILNYAHGRAVSLAERLGTWVMIASDGHAPEALGIYALRFGRAPCDERALVRALLKREFSLYVNPDRLSTRNAEIAANREAILRLIDEGLDDATIRKQIPGVSGVILRALREGLDVHRPGSPEQLGALVAFTRAGGNG
ncbi:MAG: PHP domain-containing protein [Chloroflexi bacterium]|nr:PHP domain-containing protein [Chloroflexota bacterium]